MGRDGPLGRGAAAIEVGAATSPGAASPRDAGDRSPSGRAEDDALAVLAGVGGLGPVGLAQLRDVLGSAAAVLDAALGVDGSARLVEASRAGGRALAKVVADAIVAAARNADRTIRWVEALGLVVVTVDDPRFPGRLRSIELPPHVLFVRGEAAALGRPRAVAVVGTRRPTDAGRTIASRIATAIATAGATVVSGLAVGIDGAAHDAAVRAGSPTVAVLGSGHDRLFPAAHRGLADRIVEAGGAVVSEFAPGTKASKGTFPRRNRIVSGLSEATVVVEAGARSGALITADWALQQGRGCYLVPGSITEPAAAGCLAFLREAHGEARIVAAVPELIEDLGLVADLGQAPGGNAPSLAATLVTLGATEAAVARELVAGRATLDELAAATGLPTATILSALTLLELRDLAASAYGRYRPAGRLALVEPAR